MSTSYNIEVFKGASFSSLISVKDDNGMPLNLSGFTPSGIIKYKWGDVSGLGFPELAIQTPNNSGIVMIKLSTGLINSLPIGESVYKVYVYDTGQSITILNGYIRIHP